MNQLSFGRGCAALTLALPLALASPSTPASSSPGIHAEVDRAMRSVNLRGATVGISIRDADSGEQILGINADTPLIPASNMKLLTTGAALHALGPNFSFQTKLIRNGDTLMVVGDGDPAFGDPELLELMVDGNGNPLDVESFLALWTNAVRQTGMTKVDRLIVDDRVFDRSFIHPSWPEDQLNRHYCAQVAGLNFFTNVISYYPHPRPGRTPDISRLEPRADWLNPVNKASSRTGRDDQNTVWVSRKLGTNDLTFFGNVKHAMQAPLKVAIHDVPAFFAHLLADRLEDSGVRVGRHGVIDPAAGPPIGEVVGPVISTPVGTVVTRCNRDSQNLYAESLLRRTAHHVTGQPAGWTNSSATLRHIVHERINDPSLSAHLSVADGSGLSRGNRVAAATMTAWLNTFHHDEVNSEIFLASMAEAGESGTLSNRFRRMDLNGADVRAKSGYINGVSCLSGYVTASDGRRRSFSVLVNELPSYTEVREAMRLQELIVQAIANDLAATQTALGGG